MSAKSIEVEQRVKTAVRRTLADAGLQGVALVAAVSGGPDSLCLLYALASLRDELRLSLHVAHLDHGLRPQSAADAVFVQQQAAALGLPCSVERQDVGELRRYRGTSLEEAAREVRYAFLTRVARATGAAAVVLGHTADDQAETVLLHLVRGSGLAGLRGMSPVSQPPLLVGANLALLRPLLSVTREETETYCAALGLAPRQDVSNLDVRFSRNRLRQKVLPELRRLNPRVRKALLRLSSAAALEIDFVESQAAALWAQVATQTPAGVMLDRGAMARLHPVLQRYLLRRAYTLVKGDAEGLALSHLEAMEALMMAPSGKRLSLPGGVRLEVTYQAAHLSKGDVATSCPLPPLEGEHSLVVPGETRVGGWLVRCEVREAPASLGEAGPWAAFLDTDAIRGPLAVRPRRPGDRFGPLGLEGTKKLQDFMVDARIPRAWRDRVPLVVSPEGIAWVVGWRIAHWARVTEATRHVLRLEFQQVS
ncbi:MAG: tRNA lysidine(34) synthetase TilS [Chloroflexi bacterium]|nr:tRNA lysidine(34) synthetase TilS [Chloroflexota bacterium]